jgi:hypothetical protein
VPVRIVDQVYCEITKPENDPKGEVAAALARLHNQIEMVETNVGIGYQTRRARNPQEPSGGLGEIAVDEYATLLARRTGPGFVPLALFEDPDVMDLRIARLRGVHLLNTTAWLLTPAAPATETGGERRAQGRSRSIIHKPRDTPRRRHPGRDVLTAARRSD